MSHQGQSRVEQLCFKKGLRMTDQRRVVARVLSESTDHPDVEQLFRRCQMLDANISLATVYRTVRLMEKAGILERHEFKDGRSRYEEISDHPHYHLIDIQSGHVIEFHSPGIEALQRQIAAKYGYELVDQRLELYAIPLKKRKNNDAKTVY
ncbi:Fur family transcriptional regulator [Candidatus Odyssella acanthamoebae]|uniref:Ferric uptake regulation protein n=1 Tax=Candidatus Odyssella acanthamoebae TaxID=91604 RepID=A0A077AWI1_9PROT|nr:Fur family transcriptional regulator [Candidatus Paracaedibacter acanthamoebae]AIK96801.1 Fur family transcriptional regulator [Candidatus Paracaedibacter acanthamoebae]